MITLRLDKKGGINRGDINMIETDNKSDVYIIQLYKGEEVYNLTGKTVELSILEKKRGYGDTFDLPIYEATTGKIKLEVLEGMTKTDGLFYFQITVKDSTGLVDNFPIFPVEIKNSLKDDIIGTVVNSPYMQILLDAVAKAEGAVDIVNDIKTDYDTAKTNLQADYTQTKTALQKDYDTTKTSLQTDYVAIKNNIQSDYNATKTNIQNDYNSLRKVIMDENASAELQGQINDINSDLEHIEKDKTDKTTTQNLQTQVNNLVLQAGNPEACSAEIEQARGGYSVLNERLSYMYGTRPVKNIIKNSKLNNFDNWGTYGCNASGENGLITIVPTELYAQVRNGEIPVNYGDKLYVRCGVNSGGNGALKVEVVEQYTSESYLSISCSSDGGMKYYSGIADITKSDIVYCMFRIVLYENTSLFFQATQPVMVNLTKTFGKGNEPTAQEFEDMLGDLYFENTIVDNFDFKNKISTINKKIESIKEIINEKTESGNSIKTNIEGNETQIKWTDGNNNMMLVIKPCGVNNLPQIKDIYKNDVKLLDGKTDFISPFIVAGDGQFVGDKPDSFEFTGGYHGYNGDGTGTPTARNILYKVINDNNKCKIVVVNNIQGFNTKKVDGTGKEILQEEIIYEITPCKIKVDVKLIALEWCRISTYMGLQAQNHPWDSRILICDDETHKQWMSLGYQNIVGGNKEQSSCNKLILNKDDNYLEMKIDSSYGLGKLKYVNDTSPLMWCADYNKTYFNLVKDKDLTLTKNDVICWSGEYKIYSV